MNVYNFDTRGGRLRYLQDVRARNDFLADKLEYYRYVSKIYKRSLQFVISLYLVTVIAFLYVISN